MFSRRKMLRSMATIAALPSLAGRSMAQIRGSWSTGPALPYAVQEIYPALWMGQIVVAGGLRAPGPGFAANLDNPWPTASVIAHRPRTSRWTRLPDLPAARHHPLLLANGRRLWCIGGFAADADGMWQNQPDIWWLEPGMRSWRDGPSLPVAQSECAGGVLADGSLLVAAGRMPLEDGQNRDYADQRDTGAAWRLAPGARQWEVASAIPFPRNSSAFVMVDGMLHVMGGRTFDPTARTRGELGLTSVIDHHVYHPAADRWESRPPLPAPRAGHAAAFIGGRIFIFGGEDFTPEPTVHPHVFAFDPATDDWSIASQMPTPRHGLGVIASGRRIHTIAGAAQAGGKETTAKYEIFQP